MPEREATDDGCVCGRCGRRIEDCSFCGERDCHAPMCYPDMLAALSLQIPQPHSHGG
jgi:hypothetical protein